MQVDLSQKRALWVGSLGERGCRKAEEATGQLEPTTLKSLTGTGFCFVLVWFFRVVFQLFLRIADTTQLISRGKQSSYWMGTQTSRMAAPGLW